VAPIFEDISIHFQASDLSLQSSSSPSSCRPHGQYYTQLNISGEARKDRQVARACSCGRYQPTTGLPSNSIPLSPPLCLFRPACCCRRLVLWQELPTRGSHRSAIPNSSRFLHQVCNSHRVPTPTSTRRYQFHINHTRPSRKRQPGKS
jgi:hypothetical protein